MSVLITLSVLSVIIAIHEFGHYFVARLFGVSAPIFSIGFGPRICGLKIAKTDFRISAILLGGYVKMKGFNHNDNPNDPDSYVSKPRWQRFLIAFAGPIANLISATIALVLIYFFWGGAVTSNILQDVKSVSSNITSVCPLQKNDVIIAINDTKINNGVDIYSALSIIPSEKSKQITIIRNNQQLTITLPPGKNFQFILSQKLEKQNLITATRTSTEKVLQMMFLRAEALKRIFNGDKQMAKEIAGPLGIIGIGSQLQKQDNAFQYMLNFSILISICLAFMNLLPIPILDGGLMLILLLEMTARKDLSQGIKNKLSFMGLVLILGIFILAMANDLTNLLFK